MYMPSQFDVRDRAVAAQLMRAHPFASLISVDEAGLPFVTHLPLHLDAWADQDDNPELGTLLGHCARGNPHWKYLTARPQAVVFQNLPRRHTASPGTKGPRGIILGEAFPQHHGHLLEDILPGHWVSNHRADEGSQVRLDFEK